MTYEQWFSSQQGIPYDSSWLFAKAAWEHQQKLIEELQAQVAYLKDFIFDYVDVEQNNEKMLAKYYKVSEMNPTQALEQFAAKVRNQALEDAAELVLNAGYKSNGISAYENIADAIRREMTKEMK